MSEAPALWIDDALVADVLSVRDAIDVLEAAYVLKASGAAANMPRAHLRDGDAILHAVGGAIAGEGVAGTKTWIHTPGGAAPLLVLFSTQDGQLLAIVEAFALGKLRTSATTGLGTKLLARQDAESLALLGTGKQALAQAAALAEVRPLRQVRLFGRDAGRRGRLAAQLEDELGLAVTEHDEVAEAVAGTDIVTAVTRAAEPIVDGSMLEPGMHVNAVGSIVASRRELDETAVGRCDTVVVDAIPQARDDAGELRAAAEAGLLDWSTVRPLEDLAGDGAPARRDGDITLFKALGVGLSDVAIGHEVLRRARAADVGRPITASANPFAPTPTEEVTHGHR